ncbi:MAG: amylo-alpha-1,6-glucosidase [Gammaproteobacteria bacterium]
MTDYELGRNICGHFIRAVEYEWLITNDLGGFACGTVCEAHSRRYHGLLTAALTPPTGRTLLVSKLDIEVDYLGRHYPLYCNEFADCSITPEGFLHLEAFRLDQGLPVWRYAVADALIEKRIIMQPHSNTTLVHLKILRASDVLSFKLSPLCAYRDYHSHCRGDWTPEIYNTASGFEVHANADACRYQVSCAQAEFTFDSAWVRQLKHRIESERGFDDTEDLLRPGYFSLTMNEGDEATVVLSDEVTASADYQYVIDEIHSKRKSLLQALPESAPCWIKQLTLAASQFVVDRYQDGYPAGTTIIAGYPWFTDWGRDTMIALPGLTLALGRFDIAASILRTFADHLSAGLLPNRFPDQGTVPVYNTADATLWYIQALAQYLKYGGDISLAKELFPILADIIDWHRTGTRYGIKVDPRDGLLMAGEVDVQLTWMDAKVNDWVVTPRIGKCVEINALWYNALMFMADLAAPFGYPALADDYSRSALQVKNSFQRFFNEAQDSLYDVIDGPEGELKSDGKRYDARLRPNQLFAVSLPHSPLRERQQKAVVDLCARELLTSFGLRSLAESELGFVAYYQGDLEQRDAAYHQGTVWAWLIGPFIDAHFRVYRDADKALSFLEPFRQHLSSACLGQISEIFDAEPPFTSRGCFAQAWSVGEILRVWLKFWQVGDISVESSDELIKVFHYSEKIQQRQVQ